MVSTTDRVFVLFLYLSTLRLRLLNDLLLQRLWRDVVVVHFHIEAAAALRHGDQVGAVRQHFDHGYFRLHDRVAGVAFHSLDPTSTTVRVAHDGTGEFIGHRDFHGHDGLEQRGLRHFHGLLEGNAARHQKRHIVGIHVVILRRDDRRIRNRGPGPMSRINSQITDQMAHNAVGSFRRKFSTYRKTERKS